MCYILILMIETAIEKLKPKDLAADLIKDGLKLSPVLEGFPDRRREIVIAAFLRPTYRDSHIELDLPTVQEAIINTVKQDEKVNLKHLKFLVKPLLNITRISYSLGDVEAIEFAIEMTKDLID